MSHSTHNSPMVVVNTASDRQQVPLRDYLNTRVAPFLKKAITQSLDAEAEFPLQWLGECLIHQSILYEGNPDRTNIRERFLYKFEDPKPQESADVAAASPAAAPPAEPPHRSPSAQPEQTPMPQPEQTPMPQQEPTELQSEVTMSEASHAVAEQPQPPQVAEEETAPQPIPATEEPAINGVKEGEEEAARAGDTSRDADTEMGGTS
ncbi:uncharacterized protein Z519_11685 [Cladophialophora bantiana CBS 173.52]|uniref:Uncharacterized protein n=1 Tax=Cladophialophora bantiana (strain ATCC 10958 / CBS 173.52 / CDC B-1940 / NIH 8579) TaxID=1442370 RepID=A0A0D2EC57_CLAB1|nr:uncharacterized protein Z519_11685 [Cladophialophora bantiana CBS 173.52]KIW87711.1 hypothetical protein Z519_11685 [Cladophialophora bantiana CBS 173.52]